MDKNRKAPALESGGPDPTEGGPDWAESRRNLTRMIRENAEDARSLPEGDPLRAEIEALGRSMEESLRALGEIEIAEARAEAAVRAEFDRVMEEWAAPPGPEADP